MPANLYFAYGSNLDQQDVTNWCRLHDHSADFLRKLGPAVLPDHELRFGRDSIGRGGGVLDAWYAPGFEIPGVLFEVDEIGLAALDAKEGAPSHYVRTTVRVRLPDGTLRDVLTYLGRKDQRRDFVVPTLEYWTVVSRGWQAHGLPLAVLEAAGGKRACGASQQIPRTEPLTDNLFVYGTLLRGEARSHMIHNLAPSCWILAEARGGLVDCGDFPGMIADDSRGVVAGELVKVPDIARALTTLDDVEGFGGFGRPGNLFTRKLIDVGTCDGRVRTAWVYELNSEPAGSSFISGNDWRRDRGRKTLFLQALAAAHTEGLGLRLVSERLGRLSNGLLQEVSDAADLASALESGKISERQLAQATGRWVVVP